MHVCVRVKISFIAAFSGKPFVLIVWLLQHEHSSKSSLNFASCTLPWQLPIYFPRLLTLATHAVLLKSVLTDLP